MTTNTLQERFEGAWNSGADEDSAKEAFWQFVQSEVSKAKGEAVRPYLKLLAGLTEDMLALSDRFKQKVSETLNEIEGGKA